MNGGAHSVMKAMPNAAHRAIAELQQLVTKLSVITQNVDDLHERAGSQNVLHLHGSLHERTVHLVASCRIHYRPH